MNVATPFTAVALASVTGPPPVAKAGSLNSPFKSSMETVLELSVGTGLSKASSRRTEVEVVKVCFVITVVGC